MGPKKCARIFIAALFAVTETNNTQLSMLREWMHSVQHRTLGQQ